MARGGAGSVLEASAQQEHGQARGRKEQQQAGQGGLEAVEQARQVAVKRLGSQARDWKQRPAEFGFQSLPSHFLGAGCCSPSTPCFSCMRRSSASWSLRPSFCLCRVAL